VALAIIMVPIVARTAEESLRTSSEHDARSGISFRYYPLARSLGVIIPGAMTGIITGVMLSVARIAGETAPLIFTAFGSQFGVQGLLKPIGALPMQIFRYATSPYKSEQQQAWAGAFLLIIMV